MIHINVNLANTFTFWVLIFIGIIASLLKIMYYTFAQNEKKRKEDSKFCCCYYYYYIQLKT